jgi:hypothetical protein
MLLRAYRPSCKQSPFLPGSPLSHVLFEIEFQFFKNQFYNRSPKSQKSHKHGSHLIVFNVVIRYDVVINVGPNPSAVVSTKTSDPHFVVGASICETVYFFLHIERNTGNLKGKQLKSYKDLLYILSLRHLWYNTIQR